MAGLKLEAFQGLIPRTSDRLLPNMNSTVARNTKLLSGELRGFRALEEDADLTAQVGTSLGRAFRVPDTPTDAWLAFSSRDVDIVRSPLLNDAYDRYFWAGDGVPKMNDAADIKAGQVSGPYWLGIPTPTGAPTVTPPGGSAETRAYVYTFESYYGEEGQPSPATLTSGDAGTWVISDLPSAPPDAANRRITKINIYRTVPGYASTSFYWVGEVNIGTTTYNDTTTSTDAVANPLLESTTWAPPPSDLEGFVVMPNGYLVGWVGRRLLFSEPYRPHAWPAEYELSTEFDIVGLGVVGATLVICTESQPYFGQGVSPASFTTQKVDSVEPCLSRRSIVSTPAGVLYASVNGLVLAGGGGIQIVTKDLFTKSEWANLNPASIYAANLGLQYIAFNSTSFGFILDPDNPSQRHVELDNFSNVDGIETDRYSGDVLILSDGRVFKWDPEGQVMMQWRWQSKVFQTPKPINFGAARLKFEWADIDTSLPVDTVYEPYNSALFTAINGLSGSLQRLNTLGGQVLGGSPAKPATGLVPSQPLVIENKQPFGGSMLYYLSYYTTTSSSVRIRIKVYPDTENEQTVFDKQIGTEDIFRLPTGFKADLWQFDMTGNTTVYSLQVAETPRQLAEI